MTLRRWEKTTRGRAGLGLQPDSVHFGLVRCSNALTMFLTERVARLETENSVQDVV